METNLPFHKHPVYSHSVSIKIIVIKSS